MSSKPILSIAILNLMPTKEATATQLASLLSQNNLFKVEITLLYPKTHYQAKAIPDDLQENYLTFDDVRDQLFDGFIITGAPVEQLPFEHVDYWLELKTIFTYLKATHTHSLFICWGAQAALYEYYQIPKIHLPTKLVGIFQHRFCVAEHWLANTTKTDFHAPHSRNTTVDSCLVSQHPELIPVAQSDAAGLYLATNYNGLETYVFGHPEYATETLEKEYLRDVQTLTKPILPLYYFPGNNPLNTPINTWNEHGKNLFKNWMEFIRTKKLN
ncbi:MULTISPECIES: homoserine O-acetyltransferase/O-succinyltransferase family protein [Carnobacterium]|uniref:homoserine O-acetyltransferase/O-succinyltransferase family protein n=2 Tax=Carnobacteriaceae TaxID=186828 RepID=UPI00070557DD|nr:homoserine O-succinyltransferase [Carnobacterium maltaromaticum]KRN71041.1 homoserine O-succinyltransferase [Carnobacterium maltaromaticum]TFJ76599.1 homoserine O-succinyltransferase [Carnobacterium maltaromaticum]TFJ79399.1 homoserine O-succinyltransferase [Carnobacterium maltaromaticum]CRH18933.1 Homoserine O-succinyltransferase [Carnobacterium maltaromaticum]